MPDGVWIGWYLVSDLGLDAARVGAGAAALLSAAAVSKNRQSVSGVQADSSVAYLVAVPIMPVSWSHVWSLVDSGRRPTPWPRPGALATP
jgi:hypothetical protein